MKYFPQNLDYYILIPQFISQISEESLARVRAGLHDPPPIDEEDEGGGGGGGGGWPLHGQGGLRGVVTLALDTDRTSQAAGAQTNKESKQDVES